MSWYGKRPSPAVEEAARARALERERRRVSGEEGEKPKVPRVDLERKVDAAITKRGKGATWQSGNQPLKQGKPAANTGLSPRANQYTIRKMV